MKVADVNQMSQEAMFQMQQDSWNRYILESKELIETLKHHLKGEIKKIDYKEIDGELVEVEDWEIPQGKEPPINDEGYYFTMLNITTLLDKVMGTGNLTDEQALTLVRQNMKSLATVYIVRFEQFGFKSISECGSLITAILTIIMTHITKSIEMGLIKQLSSSYSISEQVIRQNPKPEATLNL